MCCTTTYQALLRFAPFEIQRLNSVVAVPVNAVIDVV